VITGTSLLEPLLAHTLGMLEALVTPAGFAPAISTLKGSLSRFHRRQLSRPLPRFVASDGLCGRGRSG
jgi:hypothetical protein